MIRSLSDVEWIFVVLVILYALEALVWVRSGVSVFVSRNGSFRDRREASRLTGNDHGSLVFGGCWPSDMTLLCHELPIAISIRGVAAFVPMSTMSNDRPTRSGNVFPWPQLLVCDVRERDVVSDSQVICTMGSSAMAKHFACLLMRLANAAESERAEHINQYYKTLLDTDAISQRFACLQSLTPAIRRFAYLLLTWVGPVGLLMYYNVLPLRVDEPTTAAYIVILFSLWWTTVALVWRAHRRMYREDRIGRFKLIACSLLSPAVPLRAIDYLSRELLANSLHHPLAVSASIDAPGRLRETADQVVRDLVFPLAPELPDSEVAIGIVNDCRAALREQVTEFLAAREIRFEDSLVPPAAEDENSVAYCSRCQQQFEKDNAVCDMCGGRATLSLRA